MTFANILQGEYTNWLIGGFAVVIVAFLVIDLGVLNRRAHVISFRSALLQTLFWITVSLSFGAAIYFYYSEDLVYEYLIAYQTEYALSIDNIFVIILILRHFNVSEKYYHKILFWGILGAIVMRGAFILIGASLIARYEWILYIFGFFLLYSGISMFFQGNTSEKVDVEKNWLVRFARRYLNLTTADHGGKFWVRTKEGLYFTQLFLVLLLIESTDLIFAVDSIPAIFAITQDELILYTSNIFAVMGLRAMFFLLSGILDKFYLLKKGLSFVLIFIGLKMMIEMVHNVAWFKQFEFLQHLHIPNWLSLVVILGLIFGSVILSLIFPKEDSGDQSPAETGPAKPNQEETTSNSSETPTLPK